MRKIVFILLFCVLNLGCNKKSYTQEIDLVGALRDYEVERRDSVFSNMKGAASFIRQYNLSSEEVEVVGEWYSYRLGQKKEGRGIGVSISFLPNRVFMAYDNKSYEDKDGKILYTCKIGYWKVENKVLLIKFIRMYANPYLAPLGTYNEKKKLETPYYPIWKVDLYEQAAVQKEKFYYNKIPRNVRNAYRIDVKDFIRGRHVTALSFNADDSNLYAEDRPWFTFLMNPDLNDEAYMYHLMIMFTTGSLEGRGYDFTENEYNLDFSKWQ
jgi:hypothetical protein